MRPKVTELLAGLNVHLVTHLHIVRVVHYVLDHVFENGVSWEDGVHLRIHIFCLKENNIYLLFIPFIHLRESLNGVL